MTGTPTTGRLNTIEAPWGDTITYDPHDADLHAHTRTPGARQTELGILTTITPRGGTIFDIGAGSGYLTCLLAHLVGTAGHVYAIEPNPRTNELLRANIHTNRHRHVRTAQLAVTGHSRQGCPLEGDADTGRTALLTPRQV